MICENCGKEHDGSYGSGRFCSKSCRCKFNGRQANKNGKLTGHPNYNIECKGNKPRPEGWKCKWCDLIFKSRRERSKHTNEVHIRDKEHPWNYGLTKETSEKIRANSELLKDLYKSGKIIKADKRLVWTEERRKKQSENKKKFYAEHPEAHPNRKLANNRSKMSYPEKIVYDWLTEKNIAFEHNKLIRTKTITRYADFYLKDYNLIIEVDGEFWHNRKIEKDKKKDFEAEEAGYTTLRIKAKERIIDRLNNFFGSHRNSLV